MDVGESNGDSTCHLNMHVSAVLPGMTCLVLLNRVRIQGTTGA